MSSSGLSSEENEASAEIQEILGVTQPKHLGEGITSGIGSILRGTLGGVGCAVLMPAVGAAQGHKDMGIIGGIIGGAGGAVGGVIQGVNIVGGGIVTGVGQVVRGVIATPKAVLAPRQGKWWNEGKWVSTNLLDEERWIQTQPTLDEDILGEDVLPEEERTGKGVKETTLYDLLGLDPSVDSAMIKRRYFIIARKYSPDRAGANPKAQEEFRKIGNAYMILTNPQLRAKYDRVGLAKLWDAEELAPDVDPYMLYTFLFGSEKFEDYIGRLAATTEARVGGDNKIGLDQSKLLQRRRVTRLALKLADRLSKWAEDDLPLAAKAEWMAEAEILTDASYGVQLVHVIGKAYSISAIQFLGSLESGIGMPSIRQWAQRQVRLLQSQGTNLSENVKHPFGGDPNRDQLDRTVARALQKETPLTALQESSTLQSTALELLWRQTVVDITTTVHQAAQMVLHDRNVTDQVRKKRGEALECLGSIFQDQQGKAAAIPEQAFLEQTGFHALLDTVWRNEVAARKDYSEELGE